jgi:transcriptional regulator with XRE-family HTH domain
LVKRHLDLSIKTKMFLPLDKISPNMFIKSFGEIVKSYREGKNLPLRVVAKEIGIDTSTLGKIEKNERNPSAGLIRKFSKYFKIDEKGLLIASKSDNVAYKLLEDDNAIEILKAAEEKVKYITKTRNHEINDRSFCRKIKRRFLYP